MSDSTSLHRIRSIVLHLFPWMARIGIAPSGALAVRGAANRTELEGGGPAVLRVGDVAWLILDPGIPTAAAPVLYYSLVGPKGPFLPLALVTVPGGPPNPLTDTATEIAPTGSKKVTSG